MSVCFDINIFLYMCRVDIGILSGASSSKGFKRKTPLYDPFSGESLLSKTRYYARGGDIPRDHLHVFNLGKQKNVAMWCLLVSWSV